MLPAFVLYAVFFIVPFVRTFYYSFFSWNGMSQATFLGLANYVRLAGDELFTAGLGRVSVWAIASIILKVGGALVLAAMLRKRIRGSDFFTSVFFLPVVISAAAISLMFALLYDLDTGPFNVLLRGIGLGGLARNWLGDERTAFWAVIAVPIFHTIGYFFVILLAGLQDISEEIYEAAEMDGAGPFKTFTRITLPLIWPILQICIVLATTGALKAFDYVFILTAGGPGNATQVPATYMYQTIFVGLKYGYGTALAFTIFLFTLGVTLLIRRLTAVRLD
jgi:raffinose/stachyose/melibiose transport system permease protein